MNQDETYRVRRELFKALVARYKTQELAACELGIGSAQQVSHLVTGHKNIGETLARRIEKHSGITGLLNPENKALGNISLAPKLGQAIPLIGWTTAGEWSNAEDGFHVGEADEYYQTTRRHGPRTYALRIVGDSMQNTDGKRPTYFDGDIIIVDPDAAGSAGNTDRVIAKLCDESLDMERRVTFKQLVIDGPQRYLKPLNDTYKPIYDLSLIHI